jgi:hypothetical protein
MAAGKNGNVSIRFNLCEKNENFQMINVQLWRVEMSGHLARQDLQFRSNDVDR